MFLRKNTISRMTELTSRFEILRDVEQLVCPPGLWPGYQEGERGRLLRKSVLKREF
jgi:hypothetical protein